MPISDLPPAPDPATPSTFATLADTFIAALPGFVTETNAVVALLNAGAGMGSLNIAYVFDSTVAAAADPGNGEFRLNQAVQNTATEIYADLLDSLGVTQTDALAEFDNSSNTVKGYIRLVKSSDATKWLLFTVSSMTLPAGYRNIVVNCVAYSEASPFTNGDAVILSFTRAGDIVGGAGDHAVECHSAGVGAAGFGTTKTKIRRYTASTTTGTAITYADSAADGATFTVSSTGLYEIYMVDDTAAGSGNIGASVNTTEPTVAIQTITAANRLLIVGQEQNSSSTSVTGSRVVKLTAGDVVRPHTSGGQDATSPWNSVFSIRRVGSI